MYRPPPPNDGYNNAYNGDQKAPAYDQRQGGGGYGQQPQGGGGYGDADARSGYGNDDAGGYQTRNTASIGDPYSRGTRNADADRSELFSGYNAEARPAGQRNRFDDRPGGPGGGSGRWQERTPQNQEEEDEDIESIKKDIRGVKDESVNSTRNALRLAREAEETARATLTRLGDQSGAFPS